MTPLGIALLALSLLPPLLLFVLWRPLGFAAQLAWAGAVLWLSMHTPRTFIPSSMRRGNNKTSFRGNFQKDGPKDWDVVVVGSGMAGLTCAAVLAQMGKRVLVLEQHDVAGGGTHTFNLKGYDFDSGLHYVVPLSQYLLQIACGTQNPPVVFDKMGRLGTADATWWYSLAGAGPTTDAHLIDPSMSVFDVIVLEDGATPPLPVAHGEAHMPLLRARFPHQSAQLAAALDATEQACKTFSLFAASKLFPVFVQRLLWRLGLRAAFQKHASQTMRAALQRDITDPRLVSLLCGLWIDTGCPPNLASFMLASAVLRGLPMQGGAYPRGGAEGMARSLIDTIERAGGQVLVSAKVERIEVVNGCAAGVHVRAVPPLTPAAEKQRASAREGATAPPEDAPEAAPLQFIACENIVSSVGYQRTVQIVDQSKETALHQAALPVRQSYGFVMVNIGLNAGSADLRLPCANVWCHPADSVGDIFPPLHAALEAPLPADPPMMITFPSVKDAAFASKHPHKSTCQLLVLADYAHFKKWEAQPCSGRDEEYERVKDHFKTVCLAKLLRVFPQLEPHIDLVDVSSPLTIGHFLNTVEGSAVGLDVTPPRFTDWEMQRRAGLSFEGVSGLWLTGQDGLLCGQPLVQAVGLFTALQMLGFAASVKFIAQNVRRVVWNLMWG